MRFFFDLREPVCSIQAAAGCAKELLMCWHPRLQSAPAAAAAFLIHVRLHRPRVGSGGRSRACHCEKVKTAGTQAAERKASSTAKHHGA
jgi:hypothetical protein